jgi:hypothetical protein
VSGGLRKGLALAILWVDVPDGARAAVEAWAATAPAVPAGALSVGRYLAVSGSPACIEVTELADERAGGASGEGGEAALRGLERAGVERGRATRILYRQIFPPGLDERNALHGPPPALQIGRIDIPPPHEDEFNEWYNTEYLVGYLKVPGVYSARRYLNAGEGFRYLTVYELAHLDVSRQPEWDRVRAQSVWRRRIERLWTHAPGSPGIYRRTASAPA